MWRVAVAYRVAVCDGRMCGGCWRRVVRRAAVASRAVAHERTFSAVQTGTNRDGNVNVIKTWILVIERHVKR
jgi:hypothetical protein